MADSDPFDVTQDGKAPRGDRPRRKLPGEIDRYSIKKVLGQGGFGIVYLAYDEQLARLVAVKVPHPELIASPHDAEAYLAEARTVANLDHPTILPVYDVGSTDEFPCYFVSKYIDGRDLSRQIKEHRPGDTEAAELVAVVAEALHYAHERGFVHRDVKPGNILVGADRKPYVVDFGLALREGKVGQDAKGTGTPAYMSPEQARGEGHRVDRRSDIFSLGVVFYELLAGRQAFRGDTQAEILEQVTSYDPRPLRQVDDHIPKELERICHKAMAKRASERYSTANAFAEDLRHFLTQQTAPRSNAGSDSTVPAEKTRPSLAASQIVSAGSRSGEMENDSSSENQRIKIVPKGLRCFDAHDADFFLELLPGARDREGLPDSLRFWKTRVEETDPDKTFPVGLIYGPSGCGKSSLVKAGLLPRLSEDVIAVCVEATADETETRLLHGLVQSCELQRVAGIAPRGTSSEPPSDSVVIRGSHEHNLSLVETVAALRRGQGIPVGKKVLIIIDQFEQWLHVKMEDNASELLEALRQCDGGRVQCIVMVRDDFWMAATRFMRELEVRLLEGENSAAVDLFPIRHAKKVLTAFGRALGALPDNDADTSKDQQAFLDASVAGLADEDKVVCVRLALFTEMMKDKPWTPKTLKELGGTQGVGVAFLEETFSARSAPPKHRYHQQAARAVLKALLPTTRTEIKGEMKSYEELLAASGDARDFDGLIEMLDSELRVIAPVERVDGGAWSVEGEERKEEVDDVHSTDPPGTLVPSTHHSPPTTRIPPSTRLPPTRYFQLAHDYLVPALREWLTRKQKETRRGRIELQLTELAEIWNARPENRHLPSWLEHAVIRSFTRRRNWTEPERRVMDKAGRLHGVRTSLVGLVIVAMTSLGVGIRNDYQEQNARNKAELQERENSTRAEGLVEALLQSETTRVPRIVADMQTKREWVDPLLKHEIATALASPIGKLHLSLALFPVDESQLAFLTEQLRRCTLDQFPVVRETLLPYRDKITADLWRIAQNDQIEARQRFQVAAALATYAPADERWQTIDQFVTEYLTGTASSFYFRRWLTHFQPARAQLSDRLSRLLLGRNNSASQRESAAAAVADYCQDRPAKLVDLIVAADELAEFAPLLDSLRPHQATVREQLVHLMNAAVPSEVTDEERDTHWKRQSLAAVTLVRLGYGDDVWSLLELTPDPSLRSFVIYHLGKLAAHFKPLADRLESEGEVSIRRALIQALGALDWQRIPGAHRDQLTVRLRKLYADDPDPGIHGSAAWTLRQWNLPLPEFSATKESFSEGRSPSNRRWYVDGQGQTMVIFKRDATGNSDLDHDFAINCHEVTETEYKRHREVASPKSGRQPRTGYWYQAAEYCNWLSEREGILADQWVYEPNQEGKYGPEMKIKENSLQLSGYRLPTAAEWEHACRVGTSTAYSFGEPVALLHRYGQFVLSSKGNQQPVGSLLPNDAGMFDMHGNAWEWTHDPFPISEPMSPIGDDSNRGLRSGSFRFPAKSLRSDNHVGITPRMGVCGFRPARTIDPRD